MKKDDHRSDWRKQLDRDCILLFVMMMAPFIVLFGILGLGIAYLGWGK